MDGIEVALASAASNFKLKVSKMDVIKIKCATIRDGEACAYLTDDHGVAPQGGREARNRGRLETGPVATPLILKLRAAMRRLWRWRDDHYDVLENGVAVGRIFWSPSAPKHRPWMWVSNEQQGRPPMFGYEATHEAAMAIFAKNWRRDYPDAPAVKREAEED
jgi:hypothetical protein